MPQQYLREDYYRSGTISYRQVFWKMKVTSGAPWGYYQKLRVPIDPLLAHFPEKAATDIAKECVVMELKSLVASWEQSENSEIEIFVVGNEVHVLEFIQNSTAAFRYVIVDNPHYDDVKSYKEIMMDRVAQTVGEGVGLQQT